MLYELLTVALIAEILELVVPRVSGVYMRLDIPLKSQIILS